MRYKKGDGEDEEDINNNNNNSNNNNQKSISTCQLIRFVSLTVTAQSRKNVKKKLRRTKNSSVKLMMELSYLMKRGEMGDD